MNSLEAIQKKIDAVKLFLSVSLSIANAHTVDFYTCDVWDQFMAVPPVDVLTEITLNGDHKRTPEHYLNHGNVSAWWMWLSSWRLPMPTPCLASGSVWAAQSYCNPSDTLTTLNPWRKFQLLWWRVVNL